MTALTVGWGLIDYSALINELNQKIEAININLQTKKDTLSKIEEKEKELDKKINELKDLKKLSQKRSEVEGILTGLKNLKIVVGNQILKVRSHYSFGLNMSSLLMTLPPPMTHGPY